MISDAMPLRTLNQLYDQWWPIVDIRQRGAPGETVTIRVTDLTYYVIFASLAEHLGLPPVVGSNGGVMLFGAEFLPC